MKPNANAAKNALIDSSSTILLHKSGLLEKIIDYYNINMTESVFEELTRTGHAGSNDVKQYREKGVLHVLSPCSMKIPG